MNWFNNNICLLSDSYKYTHKPQYPKGTRTVYSYQESRVGSVYPTTTYFGLQYFLKAYLVGQVVTGPKIDQAEELINAHFGKKIFDRPAWERILDRHDGRLPVRIKAVREGTNVPISQVLATVENTDGDRDDPCYWLTNYLETILSQTWYPITVATHSRHMKMILRDNLERTGNPSDLPFKLHDFGFRGVSCPEQAALGAAAHMVNFLGTDTVPGLVMLRHFYHAPCAGFSVPASEHSTMTSHGREHEVEACANMLEQYPTGIVSVVSDSYDVLKCCREIWGGVLRDKVLARDGVLVIRPDSGDPPVVLGKILAILGDKFGTTVNDKGYKVLHPKVRLIQGDGIDAVMLSKILLSMECAGWSGDNIVFGSGGGLLQKLNRDTQRFAFKCSWIALASGSRDVFKEPATDSQKKSKSGRFKLVRKDGVITTEPDLLSRPEKSDFDASGMPPWDKDADDDLLETVFMDGELRRDQTLAEIRQLSETT